MGATAAEVAAKYDQVDKKSVDLQLRINKTLDGAWFIPDGLMDKIKDLWGKFVAQLNRFWQNVKEVFLNLGDPWALWDTASDWSTKVGKPVSGKVMFADTGALKVDDNWTGEAADKYKNNLLAQRNALSAIRAVFSEGVQTPLNDMARNILIFWGAMIAAAVVFIGAMYAAFTASGTIIGIPAGIVLAIGGIAELAGAVTLGIVLLRASASTAKTGLDSKMDFSAFLDQKWPKAVN